MNWKGHSILGFLFSLPFISDLVSLTIALAGALFPDLDHENKEKIVFKAFVIISMIITILSICYYFFPERFDFSLFLSSVFLLILVVAPIFLNHRGLTHSIWYAIILSLIVGFFCFSLSKISKTLAGVLILYLFTSEYIFSKLIVFSIFMQVIYEMANFHPLFVFDGWITYSVLFFIGYISHLFGDSITPQGVKIFQPFSDFKIDKKLCFIFIFIYFVFILFFYLKII